MRTPGESLIALLASASRSALIVAPFVRTSALNRLLDVIPKGIDTKIVTRWRPGDLLAGASDLGTLDAAEARSIPLLLRWDLHAKLFAADGQCLVGSANVTSTSLGWREPSNLEFLTTVDRGRPDVLEFEGALLAGAVPATRELQVSLRQLVERLGPASTSVSDLDDSGVCIGLLPLGWVPRTMNPEELYLVYAGNVDRVSRRWLPVMQTELDLLGVRPGLDEDDFRVWVAGSIAQTPLVSRVMREIETAGSLTESSLASLLHEIGIRPRDYEPRAGIQMLERWLTYFLPDQYQTIQDSIKLIRAKDV